MAECRENIRKEIRDAMIDGTLKEWRDITKLLEKYDDHPPIIEGMEQAEIEVTAEDQGAHGADEQVDTDEDLEADDGETKEMKEEALALEDAGQDDGASCRPQKCSTSGDPCEQALLLPE